MASTEVQDPTSVQGTLTHSDKEEWGKAMTREIDSLHSEGSGQQVGLLKESECRRWDRAIQGTSSGPRVHTDIRPRLRRDFSPVVWFKSVRSLIALGAQQGLKLHQMDVATTFLHRELNEVEQPEDFVEEGKERLVCRLKCSIYSLKQSPRCWNHALDRRLKEIGFTPTSGDLCLYVRLDLGEMFVVAVYVDLGGKVRRNRT